MHEGGDEPLSNTTLLKALHQVQQLRESGQPYLDSPQYGNLVSFLKARAAVGNHQSIGSSGSGSGIGPGGPLPLPLPLRGFLDGGASQPGPAQVGNEAQDVHRSAPDPGQGLPQSQAYLEHALQRNAQGSVHGQNAKRHLYVQGAAADSVAKRDPKEELEAQLSYMKPLALIPQLQGGKQSQPFVHGGQFNPQQMRLNDEVRTEVSSPQSQRHLQANASRPSSVQGNSSQRPQANPNLQYGPLGGSAQGLQTSMGPNLQARTRMLEHVPQPQAAGQGQLGSQYIPQLQAQLAVMQKAAQAGFPPPHQKMIAPGGGQDVRHSASVSSTQESPSTSYTGPTTMFANIPSAGPFLSNASVAVPAAFSSHQVPAGQLADAAMDRASHKDGSPQMTEGMVSVSAPTTTSGPLKMDMLQRSGSQVSGEGNFSLSQMRHHQNQAQIGRVSPPSNQQGQASFHGSSQHPQQVHQQPQLIRPGLPSQKSGEGSFPSPSQQQHHLQQHYQLHQQQGIRPGLPSQKPSEATLPGSSQQLHPQPQLPHHHQVLQQLQQQQQQNVARSLPSHQPADGSFSGPSQQTQQQLHQQQILNLQLQQQAAKSSQASHVSTEPSFPGPPSEAHQLQQSQHLQILQQQQQKKQVQQQQSLVQQQKQQQQELKQHQKQQKFLQQQQEHQQQLLQQQQQQQQQLLKSKQQQQLLQKHQQQYLQSQQQQQLQLLQSQQQQRQLQQKQQQQQHFLQQQQQHFLQQQQQQQHQLLLQQQQQQPHQQQMQPSSLPQPQQNLFQQEIGFTRHQLNVLRSQILAFRRIKKNERIDELLQAITPMPLNSSAAYQARSTASPSVSDRGPITLSGPSQSGGSTSEQNDNKVQSATATQDLPSVKSTVERAEEPVLSRESNSVPTQSSTTNGNVPLDSAQQEKKVPAESGKTETERSEKTELLAKVEPAVGKDASAAPKSPVPATSAGNVKHSPSKANVIVPQKGSQVARCHRGPLFDFPCVSKRVDGGNMVASAQAGAWGEAIVLGYDVRVLLLEEGVRVVDRKRSEKLKRIEELTRIGAKGKELSPELLLKLRIEQRKLHLMELQSKVRDEVEEQQQEIMAMGERAYRKFVRLCERQRADLSRQMVIFQKANREKQLKALFHWRKKLLEAQWATRDSRISRNRGVAKYHERMLREFSKREDEDRTRRMEALKNNDVDAYREMLMQQQTQMPGDAGERFEVLSSFLTQTEEYLQKLGGKISAVKTQQEREEAALAAAAAARAQGFTEEEVERAASRAVEEVMGRDWAEDDATRNGSSVNRYYSLAHAVSEQILRQPSMLRAGTLRDYQLVGLQWMLSLYNNRLNGILADEMGLGKTVQVMALIAYLMEFKGNYGPHLIIVPNAVIVNWKSELLRWLPSVSCIFYVGGKDARTKIFTQDVTAMKFNILVTTYEFIMRDRAKLSKVDWKYMIIDEAQRMKDRESRLARDLDRFQCQRRLLLTGTPLQNDLNELWSLLNLLLPDVFDSSKAFNDWFAKPFQRDVAAGQNDEDDWLETEKKVIVIHRLHQILEPFMLRRRVEDVEGSLPPKVSVVLKCKMSGLQSAIYDWVKATGTIRLDPLDEAQRVAGNSKRQIRAYAPLQNKCMELRKICNHPYLNYPPRSHMLNNAMVRSCGKLWMLDTILVKLHRTGHRVLLFSTMTRLLDILEEYLQWRRLKYRRIDGTTTLDARESAIEDFNFPGSDIFIFLLSIRAAGRGLNLQSADTVVIYDPDPNPKNEEQAVARAHRIGQKRDVRVIYMEAVVETLPSYQKEDEMRSGGMVDSDDEMAGKDRFMGSVESLVRNNIQQHKIDMADEVINAGRFDQRTSQEERRLTLEALLHDEERYQETVHNVPTLQEVNRMIARTDEEVELFDQMDEEANWSGELTKHHEVPQWLRVGSQEVDAAIAATSKQALKQGLVGAIGTKAEEERLLNKAAKAKALSLKRKMEADEVEGLIGIHRKKQKKRNSEEDSEIAPQLLRVREPCEDDAQKAAVPKEEGVRLEGGEEGEIGQVPDYDRDVEMELEEGEMEEDAGPVYDSYFPLKGAIEGVEEDFEDREHYSSPETSDDDDDESRRHAPVDASRRAVQNGQTKRFGSLAAIEGRPFRREEYAEDLEEGEIAVSGDESPDTVRSENWANEREDAEEDQVVQPLQRKRKRSNRNRRISHFVESSDRSSNNGAGVGVSPKPPFQAQFARLNPRQSQVQRVNDMVGMQYEEPMQWGQAANIRPRIPPPSSSGRPFEGLVPPVATAAPAGPRIIFKRNWANGFQDSVEDARLAHANMLAHASAMAHSNLLAHTNALASNALANWNATARMPENQQKKCKAVLGKLQGAVNKEGRTVAALFMELPKRSECPDYYKVITKPIDARIIEHRLDHFEYPGVLDFAADVQLMLDNAARYNFTSEVQADARRLQALFFQRMGLQFPDVDFSPVRTKIMAVPAQSTMAIPGPGFRKMDSSIENSEGPQKLGTEAAPPTTRGRSARPPPVKHANVSSEVLGVVKEKTSHKKKSKKEKDKKNGGIVAVSGDKIEERQIGGGGGGVVHPVDLVVLKKKRNSRERVASKAPSTRFLNVSQIKGTFQNASGNNVNSPGLNSNKWRTPRQPSPQRVAAESHGSFVASQGSVVEKAGGLLGFTTKVGKRTSKPKLRVSWVDGSKRRPGQT